MRRLFSVSYLRTWFKYRISRTFQQRKLIDKENELSNECTGKIQPEMLEDLFVSPAVKRSIWRALDVIQDLLKIVGKPPTKIFVETTREVGEKGKRTKSRKMQLEKLFKECKNDMLEDKKERQEWLEMIKEEDDGKLKGRGLYLYYIQHGKCMYCSKPLNISDIGNKEAVDRDHIYPQSRIKDDSIHNNMVLVCRECNQKKGNKFPISADVQNKQRTWWKHLRDCEFITSEKYERLTRSTELTEEELARFISRQIVETSQSVKGVITILKRVFPDADIVYVKGRNVSEFRNENDFTKCRIVNDYHHAKDAYLNIVVGNVYDVKFTKDFKKIVERGEKYNLKKMYEFDVSRDGKTAWIAGENGTISTVREYMQRNNIQFTRFATEGRGELFNQNPSKASNKELFSIKKGLAPADYGGYGDEKGAYFTLIEHKECNENVVTFKAIPIHSSEAIKDDSVLLKKYLMSVGIEDPKILIKKIKHDTLLEIDGFRCHISGRTNDKLVLKCGVQLILPDELYKYCKKISKYIEDRKNRENYSIESYGFTSEDNDRLYPKFCGCR